MSLPVHLRLGSLLTLVIGLLAAACASPQVVVPYTPTPEPTLPANLLHNPSLSTGTFGWSEQCQAGASVSLGHDLAGFLTLAVTPAAEPQSAGWEQRVPVRPGVSYRASCRVRTEGLDGLAGLHLDFYDAAGQLLRRAGGMACTGDAVWTTVGWRCRAPVGAAWATVSLGVDAARAGHAAFDDLRFGVDDSPDVRPLIVDYSQITGEVLAFAQAEYGGLAAEEDPAARALQVDAAYQAAYLAAAAIYRQGAACGTAIGGGVEGESSAAEQAYRELAGFRQAPRRLSVIGGDDLGFAVLAGKSEDGRLVRVAIADTGSSTREYRLALASFPPGYRYEVREVSERCADEVLMAGSALQLPGSMLTVPWRSPAVHIIDFTWQEPTRVSGTRTSQ